MLNINDLDLSKDSDREKLHRYVEEQLCVCGHKKKQHNRFIKETCMFIGCSECKCEHFEAIEAKEK